MMMSEQIDKLMEALAKAQGEMKNAYKDSANPYFKSKYANLSSVIDAGREALSKNGLAISQFVNTVDGKLVLESLLGHASGQWIKSSIPLLLAKQDPQSMGSAITYAKRQSWAALAGIGTTDEDDDGEKAMEGFREQEKRSKDDLETGKMFWENFSPHGLDQEIGDYIKNRISKGRFSESDVMRSALGSPEKFMNAVSKWIEEKKPSQ